MFSVTWYNPIKCIYDNFYIPTDYLVPTKVRLTSNYNYSNYIDTELSLSQLHSYNNGYGLVDNIFSNLSEEHRNWIKNCSPVVNYTKFRSIVDKVSIK